MGAEWIVQSARPNNGIKRIHFVRDDGDQPEDLFLNVTAKTAPQTFTEGDVWRVQWKLIRRRGANGPSNAN